MAVRVGVLGATGAVGQRLVQLLSPHPQFELAAVTASENSAGKRYAEAAKWRLGTPIPESVADLEVGRTEPADIPTDIPLLFSSLPSAVGRAVEADFADAGYFVSSNSSNARMAPDVPLVIPEVNADHLGLLEVQTDERDWDGGLIKNPNCSTITVTPSLAALHPLGLDRIHVATLQAVSGAGYSGVTSMEIIDNVIPHIGGEEDKVETEPRKLLGEFTGATVEAADLTISASCNRVATVDGHLENVWADLDDSIAISDVAEALRSYPSLDLESSPDQLIHVFDEPDRPQPRLDRDRAGGMQLTVGGLQRTPFGFQYNVLSHNTLRGAAGASILNGELLLDEGIL